LAKEKGSSAWLTALPLKSLGYCLNKAEFQNSIHVQYNWKIAGLPMRCACGEKMTLIMLLHVRKVAILFLGTMPSAERRQ
jgi:hypothetical protein